MTPLDGVQEPPASPLLTEQELDAWLESVVREHYRALYAYAYTLTRQHADAADLAQQTTVVLATRWKEIRERDRVKPWLFSVLYREFLRSKRRSSRFVALDEPTAEAVSCESANQETKHDSKQVVRMIHGMDEPHRSVLSLHYLDELSYRDIADVLQIPIGTVMSRLSRAKEQIRRMLIPAP